MNEHTRTTEAGRRHVSRVLAAGALFHDLGKFAERASCAPFADKDYVQQEYRYGHAHATDAALVKIFQGAGETRLLEDASNDSTFANLASRHHKPRNYLERIVQIADRWASGHERVSADNLAESYEVGGRERKRQVPLVSILGRLSLESHDEQLHTDWRYRLRPYDFSGQGQAKELFPCPAATYTAKNVEKDYLRLWDEFLAALGASEGPSPLDPKEDMETLLEICRKFQWCVPASTRREEMPDVSLFEHAKGAAAIASCLYLYHADDAKQPSWEALEQKHVPKFLLFCADIAGIQKFIYRISSKGAYKLLKGRSFYIQLLSEFIARYLIRDLGLTAANMLYASGGKCYLLLPNTGALKQRLEKNMSMLNVALFEQFNGDLHVRHGFKELAGGDLCWEKGHRSLNEIWDDLARELASRDKRRFSELSPQELHDKVFAVKTGIVHGTCEVCHATTDDTQRTRCRVCSSLAELGKKLGTARCILVGPDRDTLPGREPVLELPLGFHVWCLDEEPRELRADALVLWSVNSDAFIELAKRNTVRRHTPCAPLMLGSNHRFDREFEDIAQRAKGIKRLGILRMDVDNLGLIFCNGLKNYRHGAGVQDGRFHSLARITTLSWQLRLFFEGLLPEIIEPGVPASDKRVTVVYSGGDDLFLLGAWDALPEIALAVSNGFAEFCCRNPCFTLSGGMAITGGTFPVYKGAEIAGESEKRAKNNTTTFKNSKIKKASFTFMEEPMHWSEFMNIAQQKHRLQEVLSDAANRPLLQRMREIAFSWLETRDASLRQAPTKRIDQIAEEIRAERWRWRMVYALARQAERDGRLQPLVADLQDFIIHDIAPSKRSGIELLHVLVRWLEYLNRQATI